MRALEMPTTRDGYNAILISTIVDKHLLGVNPHGYNAILISTIVDLIMSLGESVGYNAILISTIVDVEKPFAERHRL